MGGLARRGPAAIALMRTWAVAVIMTAAFIKEIGITDRRPQASNHIQKESHNTGESAPPVLLHMALRVLRAPALHASGHCHVLSAGAALD